MSQEKVAEIKKRSDDLIVNLRKFCYEKLSFEDSFTFRRLEQKIAQDLEKVPDSFFKNLVIHTAMKDSFFALLNKELPPLEDYDLSFDEDFSPYHAIAVINCAFIHKNTVKIANIISDELTKFIVAILAEHLNPQSFMHYYLLYVRNAEDCFRSKTISEQLR